MMSKEGLGVDGREVGLGSGEKGICAFGAWAWDAVLIRPPNDERVLIVRGRHYS